MNEHTLSSNAERLRTIVGLLTREIEHLSADDPVDIGRILTDVLQQTAPRVDRQPQIHAKGSLQTFSYSRISGNTLPPVPSGYFLSDKYLSIQSIEHNAIIYCGGCDGLVKLAKTIEIQIYKWGTSQAVNPIPRMRTLNSHQYASLYRSGSPMIAQDGYTNWHAQRLSVDDRPINSPVCIGDGSRYLRVRLPHGLKYEDFENTFSAALRADSLLEFISGQVGRDRCQAFGIPNRDLFYRGTIDPTKIHGYAECDELYRLSPRYDANYVADTAERLIARFVETDVQ